MTAKQSESRKGRPAVAASERTPLLRSNGSDYDAVSPRSGNGAVAVAAKPKRHLRNDGDAEQLLAGDDSGYGGESDYSSYSDDSDDQGETTVIAEKVSFSKLCLIMGTAYLGVFLGAIDSTIIATLSAPISSEFQSLSLLSWLATAYLISNAACQPISGRLTDIFGRGPGLVFSNIFFAAGNLICGLAQSSSVMILGRVIAGIGGGGLMSISTFLGSDLIPLRNRGIAQGIGNICYGSGAMMGGIFGGLMNDHTKLGWRLAFLVQVPPAILSAVAVAILVRVPPKQSEKSYLARIDFGGVFFTVSFLVLLLLGAQGVMELRMGPSTPVFVFNIVVPKPFDWTEESYEPPEDTDILPKPASISGLTRGAYHYSYGASVAGIASALQAEVGLTFAELKLRFTAGMQLTLAGLQWLMSWTWQPSDSSVIGANVGVSVEGVMLRLELGVLRQRLIIPIALSPHNDHSLALYATVTPTVLLVLGYHFVMKPRRRIQRVAFYRAMRRALREEKQDIRRGSEETASLLRGTAQKHTEAEQRIQGLVIMEAFYGPSEDLEEARALAVDVTVALQALVQDSRLYIPGYKTKANMQGFYDPAPGVPKRLRVRYSFRGREHYGEVLDERPVVLPLQEHLVA